MPAPVKTRSTSGVKAKGGSGHDAVTSLPIDELSLDGSNAMESEEKLIIALDFGTTFSGIAYCFANQRDVKVAAIVDWPGEPL